MAAPFFSQIISVDLKAADTEANGSYVYAETMSMSTLPCLRKNALGLSAKMSELVKGSAKVEGAAISTTKEAQQTMWQRFLYMFLLRVRVRRRYI